MELKILICTEKKKAGERPELGPIVRGKNASIVLIYSFIH